MSTPREIHIERKTFRGADGTPVVAVEGLHLVLPPGSLTALIGPSGCGKTTTLRIVAGLDTDFEGRIVLPPDPRIGFVFQEPRLLPWRTVEQNVRLVLDRPDDADPGPLLESLGIADMRGRFPTELSLGLARRVSIARALVIRPDLLLLDEPSASLDEATAGRLRALILQVWSDYRPTTLLVTHNIREALTLADRLVLLAPRPGRVVGEVILDRPQPQRDDTWIEATRADLVRRFPGTVA
ncbi:ABC transporter ATP-binding protein [Methylobrevis pamukkalensis]|uniref:ABC transporter ATP-binding protein n=1 Tax=Methylobrevis pamukkalensis TaxID=1439726 RepID=UPI000A6B05CD|nr:ATP-binding cassette domain-containing protein [Methylobrevis pamukkalensis]